MYYLPILLRKIIHSRKVKEEFINGQPTSVKAILIMKTLNE